MSLWRMHVLVSLITFCADPNNINVAGESDMDALSSLSGDEMPWSFSGDVLGYIGCVVAAVFFGSQLLPLKKVETGDGMFYQWVNCLAIWLVGFLGQQLLHSPTVHPFAMLGGVIWATGNITAVPIVKSIGLGLGVLLWGSTGLLMGWASSRFGWFGISPQEVSRPTVNYCGAALCLIGSCLFLCVKSNLHPRIRTSQIQETTSLLGQHLNPNLSECSGTWLDKTSTKSKHLIGCSLAIMAGILYGSAFLPLLYIKHQASNNASSFSGASQYDLDYCYAQYNGIFLTSTIYFLIYCMAMRNRPRIYPCVILPAILSGVMWGTATYAWFMANIYLKTVITFPIVNAGYSLVAALFAVVVFKEVRGLTNCIVFVLAAAMVLSGTVMTAISKTK